MTEVVLQARGLDVFYGSSQVLFKMSLSVQKGETLALLGRNGAGKSTTLKAMAGVIPVRHGEVILHNKPVHGRASHLIARAGIGFVPEDRQIFPDLSVQDNLLIAVKLGVDGADDWSLVVRSINTVTK